jgi:predicted RecB family nuclease
MAAKITRDVLESYLCCKYKGYLKQTGQAGTPSDYETLRTALRSEVKHGAIAKIVAQHQANHILRNVVLTTSVLKCGPIFVLEATVEDDLLSLGLDGLKKVPGASTLGEFLYLPMLFHEGQHVRQEQRLLLELYGLLLSRYQASAPTSGIIWYGREEKATRIKLNPDLGTAEQLLLDLKKMVNTETPPPLILNAHCQICEFRQRCHDQAVREDNLSLLRGISEQEMKGYRRKGLLTITQLAHTFRPRRRGKRAGQETTRRSYALQALAIRDKRIYVLGAPNLPSSPVHVYLDIEGNPEAGFVYLIGLIVVENGTEKHYAFWADRKEQESEIFEQFVAEVTQREDFLVFCYGDYERAFIRRMRKRAKRKKLVDRILDTLVNVLAVIYPHIYFPTYSNSLKEIGRYLGCTWSAADASGIQSIVWRTRWEARGGEQWRQKLTRYNLDDCTVLQTVTALLRSISAKANTEAGAPIEEGDSPPIAFVKDIEKLTDYYKWGRVNFVHPEYEYVNNCAYFDYQRERVYVRTTQPLKTKRPSKQRAHNRTLRASRQLVLVAKRCPNCKSRELHTGVKKEVQTQAPRAKRVYNLALTASGIRREVNEYRASVYHCDTCGHEFVPPQHQRLDKHGHGLKSWAMFQHVAYRVSLSTVQKMCEEFFGVRIFWNEIHMFKALMARYYTSAYRKLLDNILSGSLLHVDETEVKLQTGKGYVWVFTNLEEVVYMYRPTREGEFLKELLKDFHRVLVSDFYAAYDALECPQQKCLIHLIRDINQVLLNNPFDENLKDMTRSFGSLLRAIISTVDEHGLRRKYLKPHRAAVDNYFTLLSAQKYDSEATEALRMRLLKYQEKLFTFLNYDGVPWNNNNAEHAIKQFAYYREQTVGTMTEKGLSDYLVLLSLCLTCQYKEVSFLQFLLSKERDVEAFCQRKRRRRRRSSIDLYPKGFVPPHFANKHGKRLHLVHEKEISQAEERQAISRERV